MERAREEAQAVARARLRGASEAGEVDGVDGGAGGERRDVVAPRLGESPEPMQEDHRGAPSVDEVVQREPVDLTATEFDLLAVLAREPGRPFTRAQLLELVYDVSYAGYDRTVDAHIKNLRRKIEPGPHNPEYILTIYGVGYKFSEPTT